jgi:predicted transcriptional regulator
MITGNSFTVRSDDDISELADQLASAFAEKFRRVARVMG